MQCTDTSLISHLLWPGPQAASGRSCELWLLYWNTYTIAAVWIRLASQQNTGPGKLSTYCDIYCNVAYTTEECTTIILGSEGCNVLSILHYCILILHVAFYQQFHKDNDALEFRPHETSWYMAVAQLRCFSISFLINNCLCLFVWWKVPCQDKTW